MFTFKGSTESRREKTATSHNQFLQLRVVLAGITSPKCIQTDLSGIAFNKPKSSQERENGFKALELFLFVLRTTILLISWFRIQYKP